MRIREHRGYGHGLLPGTDEDINCPTCRDEKAAGLAPVITDEGEQRSRLVRAVTDRIDTRALDEIAEMLRDPEWGVGMLEDIGDIVTSTGRSIRNYPDGRSTWGRH